MLYTHDKIVTSSGVHEKGKALLDDLRDRINRNITYYDNNDLIKTNLFFFIKMHRHMVLKRGSFTYMKKRIRFIRVVS